MCGSNRWLNIPPRGISLFISKNSEIPGGGEYIANENPGVGENFFVKSRVWGK